jgi:predicted GH43/DUF377 family glycosyl hydrolase
MFGDMLGVNGTTCVFPCGALFEDGQWFVSYGHNDRAVRIAVFDHQTLLAHCHET